MKRARVNKAHVYKNSVEGTSSLSEQDRGMVRDMVMNASLTRESLLNKLFDDRRDIDQECGYPKELSAAQYKLMYDREGIATRVVALFPEESWSQDPIVVENEDPESTEFEEAFGKLQEHHNLWARLARVDEISGIGRYGVLLLGFNDGRQLEEPLEGVDERGERASTQEWELMYLRTFDESLVSIKATEKDLTSPRFGQPTKYSLKFEAFVKTRTEDGEVRETSSQEVLVHWTRIIHVADNRKASEVYGVPRMQALFNRLYDLRKIVGGSGEMFWKGGFPGYSFEMDPQAGSLTPTEKESLKEEVANYANGLQRYIRLQGIHVNSLEPQVADPKNHVDIQLELIAISLGVPKRIFMGSEQAKLASSQDTDAWNKRIRRRQNKYLTPYVVKPLIDRLMAAGTLPAVEEYHVEWMDLDTPSDKDQAEVLRTRVEAFAKYVAGNVDQLIPPRIFLDMFAHLEPDQVEAVMDAALEREEEMAAEREEEEARMAEEAETRMAEE